MENKTILVTGANGQLGNELRLLEKSYPQYAFDFTDIQELDLCDEQAVLTYFQRVKPTYLINCAAYTAVEKAETNEALCYKVNRDAVGNLARAAALVGTKVLHVSTDYVFDGSGNRPYVESDAVCPVSVYGKSKLAGEEVLQQTCSQYVILRTAWLYSSFGNNFVKTMIRLGRAGNPLKVVMDQIGTPTYAGDLAKALMTVVEACEKGHWVTGIFHFTDEGVCSWYDFTKEIHRLAGIECEVKPVSTAEYPTAAARPAYSVLDKSKIKATYHIDIPEWKKSLAYCMTLLKENENN